VFTAGTTLACGANMNSLGVGIIGASPLNPGWAVNAHIPALKALPD